MSVAAKTFGVLIVAFLVIADFGYTIGWMTNPLQNESYFPLRLAAGIIGMFGSFIIGAGLIVAIVDGRKRP